MSLRSEIQDQPEMLRALDRSWVGDVERLRNVLGKPRGVLLVGRGTSDNAARFGQYLFGIDHGLPSALTTPSLYSGYLSQPAFPSNWMIEFVLRKDIFRITKVKFPMLMNGMVALRC